MKEGLGQRSSVIVLAAGESRRFDLFPKQLVEFEGRTLIRRAVETALASSADAVCVVLGANADRIKPTIDGLPVLIVVNEDWPIGIGTSIRAGLETLDAQIANLQTVAITLADQPLITSGHLDRLLQTESISATGYSGTYGVPAAFSRSFFPDLLALAPSDGAKQVIERTTGSTTLITLESAGLDIDTRYDFERLRNISVTGI